MEFYQTAVELLFCNCTICILGGGPPFAVAALPGCVNIERTHLHIDIQYGAVLAKSSPSFLYQDRRSTIENTSSRPAMSATTTPVTLPGVTTTSSMPKMEAVVDMSPRNYDRVRGRSCREELWSG